MTSANDPLPELAGEGEPFRLLPLVNALLRRRWTVVAWTAACAGAAIAWVLLATPSWTSTAKFLPSKASAMSSRMTAIAGGSGAVLPEDDAGSADYYVTLVQSPGFLGRVAERRFAKAGDGPCSLVEHYGISDGNPAVRTQRAAGILQGQVSITAARAVPGAPRVITLQAVAERPELSAEIAQVILSQIDEHNASARDNRAKRNREFVEEQAKKAKTELDDASDALATFEAKNRRAEAPRVRAEQERLSRQVRLLEEVYVTLTKQLELAKVEEEESRPSIEVIQRPEPPLVRTSPRRTQTVVTWTLVGLVVGCLWALVSERMRRGDPDDPESIEFRGHLRDLGRMVGLRATAPPGAERPTP
jgi:uncharacterized protein involved in exopolysaccharide biosynthesis